jgi:phytoene dehydrogenase-like protein
MLAADLVVTAVPPHVVARLLSEEGVRGLDVLSDAPTNSSGLGCFKLDIALEGRMLPTLHQEERHDTTDLRKPTLFFGSIDQVLKAESEAGNGEFPSDPPWTATILSATDPSQAPEGQDTVYLYAPAPVHPAAGWKLLRPQAELQLRRSVSEIFGDFEAFELGSISESPQDLEARLGARNGCIYHVDQVTSRLGPRRPGRGWAGHRTRVPGLFLSGAGTHPGGGVSGIPGQLAAKAALRSRQRSAKITSPRRRPIQSYPTRKPDSPIEEFR